MLSKKLKCVVIDDDPLIGNLIKHFCTKSEIIDYCIHASNLSDALKIVSVNDFDLIFLDYHLPDGTGQSFLEFNPRKTPVIMITANTEFAIKGYEYAEIVDYLVKPLSFDRFTKAIQKLNQNKKELVEYRDDLFIRDGIKNVRIKLSEIFYIKSEDNYVCFITPKGQTMALYNMKDLESKLPAFFVRVHRSYIINLNVLDYITNDEAIIKDIKIPIGDKYKQALEKKLHHL